MAVFLIVSLASFLVLVALGLRVLFEGRGSRTNIAFAAFCLVAAAVSFIDFSVRLAESMERAVLWSKLASVWPFAVSFFFHYVVLFVTSNKSTRRMLPVLGHLLALFMAILFYWYARDGGAVVDRFGYSIRSPVFVSGILVLMPIAYGTLQLSSFVLLVKHLVRTKGPDQRRETFWLLGGYAGSMVFVILLTVFSSLLGWNLPELTGLSYAVFAAVMFVAIQQRNVLFLTPRTTAAHIVASMQELLLLVDQNRLVAFANGAARATFGTQPLVGRHIEALFCPPALEDATPSDTAVDTKIIDKGGGTRTLSVIRTPVMLSSGATAGEVYVARDVTEERLAGNRLEASLEEARILLQEVHHRVKNTLQLVISLINLKADDLSSPEATDFAEEMLRRIRVIAAAYDQAYSPGGGAHIDLGYLVSAVARIVSESEKEGERIAIEVHTKPAFAGLAVAIPLGLITAELMANIYHHAYPASTAGTATLSLACTGETIRLAVSDEGRGLEVATESDHRGLAIVSALCMQIGARFEMVSAPQRPTGTECIVTLEKAPDTGTAGEKHLE